MFNMKEYQRLYHKKRWAKKEERLYRAERNVVQREKCMSYQRELKERTPCADCGRHFHFAAMDFDHVRGSKVERIAELAKNGSFRKMIAEIKKCEIVCSNCHRVRTFVRYTGA